MGHAVLMALVFMATTCFATTGASPEAAPALVEALCDDGEPLTEDLVDDDPPEAWTGVLDVPALDRGWWSASEQAGAASLHALVGQGYPGARGPPLTRSAATPPGGADA